MSIAEPPAEITEEEEERSDGDKSLDDEPVAIDSEGAPSEEEELICTEPIDVEHADELITDALAKDLIKRGRETVVTEGNRREIINVDTLSRGFLPGDRVDVNILKRKSLIPYDTAYIKVLARGVIDKPLSVYANDFSLSAVKMITLAGGEAVKVITLSKKEDKNSRNT